MTGRWPHLAMGLAMSLALVLGTAALSAWPAWQSVPNDYALMRLSFTTSGIRRCRDRTPEELDALPRNMRQDQVCERRRAPVYVELDLDGRRILAETLAPSGLAGSGPSRIYRRFELPAGDYDVAVRLRTDPAAVDFTSTARRQVTLRPGQSVAVDYDAGAGGFIFNSTYNGE